MCGIMGYIGKKQAGEILLDGLTRLEYRGYDSAGIAVFDGKTVQTAKAPGRLQALKDQTEGGKKLTGTMGIGHTRWATHGAPTQSNAHPHFDQNRRVYIVHNGIIENYLKLKEFLSVHGCKFSSDTDSEVIAQLIAYYYKQDPFEAISKALYKLEGAYALGIIFDNHPDRLFAVRKDSPLIVGSCSSGSLIASDVPAVLKYTREVHFIQNGEIAVLERDRISFFDIDREPILKTATRIEWDIESAEKGGFAHFMLKEIYEQPKAVENTLLPRLKNGTVVIEELGLTKEDIRDIKRIVIVACGSAYYTGMAARNAYESIAGIPVETELASEFRYRDLPPGPGTLVVIVSQSGETADSLAALRIAKHQGLKTLSIVNVVGSSIARESDHVMYTWAGPEIAVATTKAYSCQLIAHYLLALKFAVVRGKLTQQALEAQITALRALPGQIQSLLRQKEDIQHFANRYLSAKDVFFIGRGTDYAIAMEGSLKLKEIAYIHSEAYAAGELKHGTISLIEEGTLVAAVVTQQKLYAKTLSNVQEVRTRGAFVLTVTQEGNAEAEHYSDYVIRIPQTEPCFTASLAVIPLQLLSYYIALGRGCDVDKPRNLAKSVTVE